MESVVNAPGVTFHVEHATRTEQVGRIELHADVTDGPLWDEVVQKLDGFRVYTVRDMQEALMDLMQREHKEEKAALVSGTRSLSQENEVLRQRVSVLEQSNAEHIRVSAQWETWAKANGHV